MKTRFSLDTPTIFAGTVLALVVGLAMLALLSGIASPSRLKPRLAEVRRQTDQAEWLAAHSPGAGFYPKGAVCQRFASAQIAPFRSSLQDTLTRSGLTLAGLTVIPGSGDEAGAGLIPITFSFEAKGRYDQAMTALKDLSRLRPLIFVDQADLTSQVSAVSLKLSGRIYCSSTALRSS